MKRLVLLAAVAAAARRRVAVCFWGINRSLDLTLPSIQRHLLAPLADHDVQLFFHTLSAEMGAFDAGADELPAPPPWARETCPAFFDDEFWRANSDCETGFWLGECSDPPRLRYANTGAFGGRVADLLRMTQTALTSQKTSGRTDQGKFTTYFTRGLARDSRLTLDYCAELVTNAFRLTPSARRKDTADSLLADGSKACLVHYNGPSKFFWRAKLSS